MPLLTLAIRTLAIASWAVWVGGFTFYGAVVLWVVHDAFGSIEAGGITQRVTDYLNAIGVGTLAVWWLLAAVERDRGRRIVGRGRLALLALTSALLAFLIVDHRFLDDRLEQHGLTGFYAHHRVYLIASTIQWAVNLLLLPATLRLWQDGAGTSTMPGLHATRDG